MPNCCEVPTCLSLKTDHAVSFFAFPKHIELRNKWLKALNIPLTPKRLKNFSKGVRYVCHLHFDANSYNICIKRTLLPDAEPILLNTSSQPTTIIINNASVSPNSSTFTPVQAPLRRPLGNITNATPTTAPFALASNVTPTRNPPIVLPRRNLNVPVAPPQVAINSVQNVTPEQLLEYKRAQDDNLLAKKRQLEDRDLFIKNLKRQKETVDKQLQKPLIITQELLEVHFPNSKTMVQIFQIQLTRYSNKCPREYSPLERALALTIYYSCGKKGYSTLKGLGFKLPCLSSISAWICKLKFVPGRSQDALDCLKGRIEQMNEKEKDFVLSFDETAIKPMLSYNRHWDIFEGFATYPDENQEMQVADECLVIMARGINTNLKMPLSFHLSKKAMNVPTLTRLVKETITDLQNIGVKIRAIVCDQGGNNQGLFNALGVTMTSPFFDHESKKIYAMFDAPHLMKCLRNNLLNHGYIIPNNVTEFEAEEVTTFDPELIYGGGDYSQAEPEPLEEPMDEDGGTDVHIEPEHFVLWSHLKHMYDIDVQSAVRLAPRLRGRHFYLNRWSKMKVKWATQILSRSVSAALRLMIFNSQLPEHYLYTAEFCEKTNDIFDLLNISSADDNCCPLKSGRKIFQHKEKLEQFRVWVSKIKVKDRTYVPTLRGLQLTLKATYLLVSDLEAEGYEYVLTRRFQSDCVENLFAFLKYRIGCGDRATAVQIRQAYRFNFISNLISSPEGANCEKFEEGEELLQNAHKLDFVLSKSKRRVHSDLIVTPTPDDNNEVFSLEEVEVDDEMVEANHFFDSLLDLQTTDSSLCAAVYMAGWAIKKTIEKLGCKNCLVKNLEFKGDRDGQQLVVFDEQFLINKAYDPKCFEKITDLGFGHLANEKCREVYKQMSAILHEKSCESFNTSGTKVTENIFDKLKNDSLVHEWLCEGDKCYEHRKQMIMMFVRAHLHMMLRKLNNLM